MFQEVTLAEIGDLAKNAHGFRCVSLDEYFEDDRGNALDTVGLVKVISGHPDPIIAGNPRSVTRLGPSSMRMTEKWTPEKANDIAHYLQIIEKVTESDWYRSPFEMECIGGDAKTQKVIGFRQPPAKATREVLLSLRQLYSNDDVFNFACNHYMQHVDHDGKRLWVKDRKTVFNAALTGEPFIFKIDGYTLRDVLDLFMYGCGEVHRRSADGIEEKFRNAIEKLGKEHVMMSFGTSIQALLVPAIQTYEVVSQDFTYWTQTQGAAGPNRLNLDDLQR
jgi:hypothetical protein